MKYPLSIEALEVLDAIDSKGSFAAAADELYRVPSAITYTIQKLEQDLGVTLFRKEGRKSVLTPAGEVLLTQGRELLAAADRLSVTVKQVATGWEPVINIAVESVLGVDSIYSAINEFYSVHPDIEVNVYEEVLGGAWESIALGRADVVVGAAYQQHAGKGITSQRLAEVDWVFAVSPTHPLAREHAPLELAQIENHRLVVVRDSSVNYAPLSKRLFTTRPVLRVPSVNAKILAQVQGLGVGFLPRHLIHALLKSGELVEMTLDKSAVSNDDESLSIAWKTGNRGRATRWFVEHIPKLFEDQI